MIGYRVESRWFDTDSYVPPRNIDFIPDVGRKILTLYKSKRQQALAYRLLSFWF